MGKQKLQQLIDRLADADAERNRQTGLDAESGTRHPPATPHQIEAFEAKQGFTFPPSYRLFLSLHNGWEEFRGVYTLTGVSGAHTERLVKNVAENLRIFRDQWKPLLTEDADEYLDNKIIFSVDFAGKLMYFDPRHPDTEGEYPAIRRNSKGKVIKKYASFIAMLQSELEFVERELGRT